MDDTFAQETRTEIQNQAADTALHKLSAEWIIASAKNKYTYHFSWLGLPIIQFPQDIVAMQELLWQVKPDLVIETGIARGGSLIFYASMLALNAQCGGPQQTHVLGIDIDIRQHNREAIEAHPLSQRITMMQGSSVAPETTRSVRDFAEQYRNILVCLDSNHTHDHVLAELRAYAPLVSAGSYCVVFDTAIENVPADFFPERPWGKGNNPMTAVDEFLKEHDGFIIDEMMDAKLMISVAPRGYLKRIR